MKAARRRSAARMLCHKFHTLERVTMFLFRSSLIPTPRHTPKQQVTDVIS